MKPEILNIVMRLKTVLDEALFLNGRAKQWSNQMSLLGNVPELDSIAVVNVVSAIELNFSIFFEDDDINAEVFATIETLAVFIKEKLGTVQLENAG